MLQKLITLLYVSGEPLPVKTLAFLVGATEAEILANRGVVKTSLETIGLSLLESPEGLSIVTKPEYSSLIASFWKDELDGDLTPAQLQVLTLVAYLGNPTREQISYIRGVQSAQSVRTLTVRGLIMREKEVCMLTKESLKQLGITKVEELPDYERVTKDLQEKLAVREI
jgi:segregation and condensation protein B